MSSLRFEKREARSLAVDGIELEKVDLVIMDGGSLDELRAELAAAVKTLDDVRSIIGDDPSSLHLEFVQARLSQRLMEWELAQ